MAVGLFLLRVKLRKDTVSRGDFTPFVIFFFQFSAGVIIQLMGKTRRLAVVAVALAAVFGGLELIFGK
jgi:hypothetical protein